MTTDVHQHPREALAERNEVAILDAAERLLGRGCSPTVISCACASDFSSRLMVYSGVK